MNVTFENQVLTDKMRLDLVRPDDTVESYCFYGCKLTIMPLILNHSSTSILSFYNNDFKNLMWLIGTPQLKCLYLRNNGVPPHQLLNLVMFDLDQLHVDEEKMKC